MYSHKSQRHSLRQWWEVFRELIDFPVPSPLLLLQSLRIRRFLTNKIKLVGRQRSKISPAKVCPPDSSSLEILTQKNWDVTEQTVSALKPNHPIIYWKEVAVVELNPDVRVIPHDVYGTVSVFLSTGNKNMQNRLLLPPKRQRKPPQNNI